MKNHIYRGVRNGVAGGGKVTCDGKLLNPRRDLRNHSPDGFNWSYGGSGPAQLALAILAREVDDGFALEHYQEFKWAVISLIHSDEWRMTSQHIRESFKIAETQSQ